MGWDLLQNDSVQFQVKSSYSTLLRNNHTQMSKTDEDYHCAEQQVNRFNLHLNYSGHKSKFLLMTEYNLLSHVFSLISLFPNVIVLEYLAWWKICLLLVVNIGHLPIYKTRRWLHVPWCSTAGGTTLSATGHETTVWNNSAIKFKFEVIKENTSKITFN